MANYFYEGERLREQIPDKARPVAKIPKPHTSKRYRVVEWGTKRDGEESMFYEILSSKPGGKPTTKSVSISTIKAVARHVERRGEFDISAVFDSARGPIRSGSVAVAQPTAMPVGTRGLLGTRSLYFLLLEVGKGNP